VQGHHRFGARAVQRVENVRLKRKTTSSAVSQSIESQLTKRTVGMHHEIVCVQREKGGRQACAILKRRVRQHASQGRVGSLGGWGGRGRDSVYLVHLLDIATLCRSDQKHVAVLDRRVCALVPPFLCDGPNHTHFDPLRVDHARQGVPGIAFFFVV
jgi:hypothetical protein